MTEQSENYLKMFDEQWQRAIVGLLFNDCLMYYRCKRNGMKAEWFTNPNTAEICKRVFDYVTETGTLPGIPENLNNRILTPAYPNDHERLAKYRAEAINCVEATKTVDKSQLTEMLTMWMKASLFQNSFSNAAKTFNQHKYKEAIQEWKSGLDALNAASFMEDGRVGFDDGAVDFFTAEKNQAMICATIGHPAFDRVLTSNEVFSKPKDDDAPHRYSATGERSVVEMNEQMTGSLRRSDNTVLVGPSNAGKTTTLVSIIAANILLGKKVLFITHEMSWQDIKAKIYASVSGYTLKELSSMNQKGNENIKAAVAVMENYLRDNLVYIPWVKIGHMNVEEIISLIKEKNQELKAINKGQGFDLVIDDYPGKLRSEAYANKRAEIWDERRDVYSQFMTCAREEGFHGMWPIQTNREGYKINRGDNRRLLDISDVAESFGVMMDADNVITLNRSPTDVKTNKIRYHVSKCRGGTTGHVFLSSTNFAISRTFHLCLPSMIYHSSSPPSEVTADAVDGFEKKDEKEANNGIVKTGPMTVEGSIANDMLIGDQDAKTKKES